jgi:hypothetical protein
VEGLRLRIIQFVASKVGCDGAGHIRKRQVDRKPVVVMEIRVGTCNWLKIFVVE